MNPLAIVSGVDIPIPELGLVLHQPTIMEISYLESELEYFLILQLITFDRRILMARQDQDNSRLQNMSDFEIFMTLLMDPNSNNTASRQNTLINVF